MTALFARRARTIPVACLALDPQRVSKVLAKHMGAIGPSARELGVSEPDLRRLTWAKPKLLEAAHEEIDLILARANGEIIRALFDPDSSDRRREWAADWVLASRLAEGHPFATAGSASAQRASAPQVKIEVRFDRGSDKS
jgi:hypothetical protein